MKICRRLTSILIVSLFLSGLFVFVDVTANAEQSTQVSSGSAKKSSDIDYQPEIKIKSSNEIAADEANQKIRDEAEKQIWKNEHAEWEKNNKLLIWMTLILLIVVSCAVVYRTITALGNSGIGCVVPIFLGVFGFAVYKFHLVTPCYVFDVIAAIYLLYVLCDVCVNLFYRFFGTKHNPKVVKSIASANEAKLMGGKKMRTADVSVIAAKDPGFNQFAFIERVKKAFCLLKEGYGENNLAKFEFFLSDDIFELYQAHINQMIAENIINKIENLMISEAYISKCESKQDYEYIYVNISARYKNYRINAKTKSFIDGDKHILPFIETWCFMRKIGAKTLNRKGLLEGFCPGCGNRIEGSRLSECHFCNAPLHFGNQDWFLASIESSK